MFGFLKKKKNEEELYLEELEQRKRNQGDSGGNSSGFELTVEDVFSISGRGTVVTGRVSRGELSQGDRVLIRCRDGRVQESRVGGIEAFRKTMKTARAGEIVGVLLQGVTKDQVGRGDTLTAP